MEEAGSASNRVKPQKIIMTVVLLHITVRIVSSCNVDEEWKISAMLIMRAVLGKVFSCDDSTQSTRTVNHRQVA